MAQTPLVQPLILARLRWPIFEPLISIKVLETDHESTSAPTTWRNLFENPHHSLAAESITEPPTSRMLVNCDDVHRHDYWADAEDYDSRPRSLLIENLDGKPISVGQFVEKVHAYLGGMKDLMWDLFGLLKDEQTRMWVARVSAPDPGDDNVYSVGLVWDNQLDQHWENNMRLLRAAAAEATTL
ncbi:hypothetical protein BJ508DRAFT_380357 [Ascobolus immersus RN42]|uniref:Uncharacterized protein n=1 Tax=Ascobolus immersus RN42 TaxID=1160509 RepID=A0A3N4HS58_ASCIM|nr:hypothetical protein BJ508DRAFT_380357 [Ascobolus immersus RN42]